MREADLGDMGHLVGMAQRFHETQSLPYEFDPAHMAGWFEGLIGAPSGVVLTEGQGFIAGAVMSALSSPRWLSAYEVLWWSEDGRGVALMDAFEAWARSMGAREVKYSHPVGSRAGALLKRRGHVPAEMVYAKEL